MRWMRSLDSVPTIKTLREQATLMQVEELEKARKRLLAGDDPDKVLDMLAHNLTKKYLHEPSHRLRLAEMEGNVSLISAARKLFDLK